jgi:hypothetical protein
VSLPSVLRDDFRSLAHHEGAGWSANLAADAAGWRKLVAGTSAERLNRYSDDVCCPMVSTRQAAGGLRTKTRRARRKLLLGRQRRTLSLFQSGLEPNLKGFRVFSLMFFFLLLGGE